MLVVMQRQATQAEIDQVVQVVEELQLTPHPLIGASRTAIGIVGNLEAVDARRLEVLPGVRELIHVTKPYKLVSREMHPTNTVVNVAGTSITAGQFTIIAGPCSCEDEDTMLRTAEFLLDRGIRLLRAGAFKPRTSPYSFQGAEHAGLELLARVRSKTGIGIVTELIDASHADAVEQAADMIQIGTRNMQNFSLLKRAAKSPLPVLLKRGLAATLDEWLMAAEYLMAGGNSQVVLCERGVRTFVDHSRNTLDLSVIPPLKERTHLPVLVDPSHGTGKRDYVPAMSLAGLAAGADGLLLETHPDPDRATSDGAQTLSLTALEELLETLKGVAAPLQKRIN